VQRGHLQLHAFYEALRLQGILADLPESAFPPEQVELVRAAARLRADFALRTAETLMTAVGDVSSAMIYAGVLEGAGQPYTIAALSRRLRMAEETVRRRVMGLAELGICRRVTNGVVLNEEDLSAEPAASFFRANVGHVHRLFSGLAERGVLRGWG
jgi:hypothetical protein